MQFRILGPVEVLDGQRLVELGRPKQRVLLAVLLVHANQVVALDQLIEELWGCGASSHLPRRPPRCRPTCRTCAGRWSPIARRERRRGCWSPSPPATGWWSPLPT